MFDYDWFFGSAYEQQKQDALVRLAQRRYPDLDRTAVLTDEPCREHIKELESRTMIYLRDGFSYELKALAGDVESKTHLTFECEPAEESYKVGTFVVSVPFEEICRVEIYAVHPEKKPENKPLITGFKHSPGDEGRA